MLGFDWDLFMLRGHTRQTPLLIKQSCFHIELRPGTTNLRGWSGSQEHFCSHRHVPG